MTPDTILDETPQLTAPLPATPERLTTKFPSVVDATMRREYLSCPRSFYYRYILGLTLSTSNSVHLIAGGAFADGCEATRHAYYDSTSPTKGNLDESILVGVNQLLVKYGDFDTPHVKNAPRMAEALDFYFRDAFPLLDDTFTPKLSKDGIAQVEHSFSLELEEMDSVYAGRFDGFFTDGICNYILDDKTTTSLGAHWLKQWEMRSQFTGYVYAAEAFGIKISGILVRGISILKTKFGHAQVMTQRSTAETLRWWEVLNFNFQCAKEEFDNLPPSSDKLTPPNTIFPPNLDEACCAYSGCQFFDLCKNNHNPHPFLSQYSIARWNPIEGEVTYE